MNWLETPISPRIELPIADANTRWSLTRHQLLWMCGNPAKHSPSRLIEASKEIQHWLTTQGQPAQLEQMPLFLHEFRQRLSHDMLIYYATKITALLNDVRWGLQSYLAPLLIQTFRSDDSGPTGYHFEAPGRISTGSVAHKSFQDLMNHVRAGPAIPPFRVSGLLQNTVGPEW